MRNRYSFSLLLTIFLLLVFTTVSHATIIYVSKSGNDFNPGTILLPKLTITAAMTIAVSGDEIHVAEGTYNESFTLTSGVVLKGGYSNSSNFLQRNSVTILDGTDKNDSIITVQNGATSSTVIDGFTITNGNGKIVGTNFRGGGGIYCDYASPTISHNIIQGNCHTTSTLRTIGGGIFCNWSSATISHNTIRDNWAKTTDNSYGGGILCNSSSLTIEYNNIEHNEVYPTKTGGGIFISGTSASTTYIQWNTISNNKAGYGAGIYTADDSLISSNYIFSNDANVAGGGVFCQSNTNPVTIANNMIYSNTAATLAGAISCQDASPDILSNTIVDNTSGTNYGAVLCYNSSSYIRNNIIAFNSAGIYKSGTGTLVLNKNDVYSNTGFNYSGLSAGVDDISIDPRFKDRTGGDYHLAINSHCINAGNNSYIDSGWLDIDGDQRIIGTNVDIGADECSEVSLPTPTVTINQSATQAGETRNSPIHFTAVFSDPVVGFGANDVILNTETGQLTASVADSSGNMTYDISVTGMNNAGNVIASIQANAATYNGVGNSASTSTDNTVLFDNVCPNVSWSNNWSDLPIVNIEKYQGTSIAISGTTSDLHTRVVSIEFAYATDHDAPATNWQTKLYNAQGITNFSFPWYNSEPGNYTVWVRATDAAGNQQSISKNITIKDGVVLYVHPDGTNPDGQSWATAFHEIQDALNVVDNTDAYYFYELWVAEKTTPYAGISIEKSKVSLYGGFAGGETSVNQRNWNSHPTRIFSNDIAVNIYIPYADLSRYIVIDGFSIIGTNRGIYASSGSIATTKIQNNNISASNTAIEIRGSSSIISYNKLHNLTCGMVVYSGETAIYNNLIYDYSAVGIIIENYNAFVYNNLISGIPGNSPYSVERIGMICYQYCNPCVYNNIIAHNNSSIDGYGTNCHSNNAFMDNDYNYYADGDGEIIANISFVDAANHDYHLSSGSAGINAGRFDCPAYDYDYVAPDDFDHVSRPVDNYFDIGPYERGN